MSSESEIENEIHEAHFAIPPLDISTADAKALVRASPVTLFCDLKPGQPGVAAKTWQELATVATEPINICWLGRQPDPFGDYVDYNEVHADDRVQTNLRYQGHCDRFGEKALKHGGIDIVLRTLHEFEKCHGAAFRVGYNGVKDVFHEAYYGNSLLRTLPKHEFFLDNYDRLIAPRLLAVKRRKEEEAVEAQRVEDAKPENVAKRAEETELAMELAASMGMKPDRESPQSRPQAPPPPYQPPTRQAVANEILAKNLENDWNENGASTEEALRACRRALGAQMVACYPPRYGGGEKDAQRAFERHGLTGWDTLEYMRDERKIECLRSIVEPAAATFRPYAQGGKHEARWVCDAGNVPYVPYSDEAYELVELCVKRRAFDDDGLRILCRWAGVRVPTESAGLFEARRNRDAMRVVAGMRASKREIELPKETPGKLSAIIVGLYLGRMAAA